jgi:predicted TIM-barrel fold metal-dependent hydrolase
MIEQYGEEKTKIYLENSTRYRDQWRKMWLFDPPEKGIHSDEEQAKRWVDDLDKKGIERVNFVMGGGNDNLAKIIKLYPDRFTGFAHHDIHSDNAADELERAINKLGLRGFKFIASSQKVPIEDKSTYTLWEKAADLDIPIILHFGVLGGGGGPPRNLHNMNPLSLWPVASDFPTIKFVVPHFGACYLRELLQLCWQCSNVLIDTSGSNQWMRWMPNETSLIDVFRRCIESIGPERLIFGTDSSYFPRGFSDQYLREQLKTCYEIGLPEESIKKIFYKNAKKLLKL